MVARGRGGVLAAALGAGLDLASPAAQLLVDLGDGVTDVALIRVGRVEQAGAIRKACGDLRWAIVQAVADAHRVLLPLPEAQRLLEWVSLDGPAAAAALEVRGCRMADLAPADAWPTVPEIEAALDPVLREIAGAVQDVWRRLTPEAAREVVATGICVTGGGGRLGCLTRRIQAATGLAVRVAPDPTRAVIREASRMAGLG